MLKEQKTIYVAFVMLVVAFVFLSYLHEVIKIGAFSELGDFCSFYFHAKALRLNYNPYTQDEVARESLRKEFGLPQSVYIADYSLIFYNLVRGLTFLEYRTACIIWLLLNNILLFSSILIILRLAFAKIPNVDRTFIVISSVFLVFSFQPLIEDLFIGQVNLPVLFLFTLALYSLNQRRPVLSGALLGLGILIRPFFAILMPFLLWKRCYRVFFAALISLIVLELSGVLFNGIDIYVSSWQAIGNATLVMFIKDASMTNYALGALINRIANLPQHPDSFNIIFGLTFILSLSLFVYTLYITKGRFRELDLKFILGFSLMIICGLIISPVVHEHHYVFLYLPIIFVWSKLNRDEERVPLVLFIVSFLPIGLKYFLKRLHIFNTGLLSIFSGFKLYGVALLFFLVAYMIKKIQKEGS